MNDVAKARAELVEIGRLIEQKDLIVGPGGNTSVRVGDVIYVKASGKSFEEAVESDYVGVAVQTGELVDGDLKPTSEIAMHRGCYLVRDDIRAVVHTHPPFALGVASAGKAIEPMCPDYVALIGREIPLIDYVVPTGQELADAVVPAIKEHNAVLLANHGVVTVGRNLREAYYRNLFVESAAKALVAAEVVGTLRPLTDQDVAEIDGLATEKYRRDLLKDQR